MKNEFDKYLEDIYKEITALKQARLKSAGLIATTDYSLSATFTVTEMTYGLFSSQALYITATSGDGDSFLSQLYFSGDWDGRGYEHCKIYENKGVTKWCVAMTVPTAADYQYYYEQGGGDFDISINMIIRTTSEVTISTEWGSNPYDSVW